MFKVKLNLRKVATIIACLAVTSMMFSGCKKDETSKNENPDNPETPVLDPEGTMTANISESTPISVYDENNFWMGGVYWKSPDNFLLSGHNGSYWCYLSICNLGKINGLGNITKIPSSGFSTPMIASTDIACEVGHGYVIKFDYKENGETKKTVYARLFVVESIISTTGGIMGAKVKYQYPFEP